MSSKEERKDSSEKERKPRRKLKREAEAGALSVDKKWKTSPKVEVKQKADLKTKNVVSTALKIPVPSQTFPYNGIWGGIPNLGNNCHHRNNK